LHLVLASGFFRLERQDGQVDRLPGRDGPAEVLLELSVTPLGKGEGVSPYVARCLDVIDASGLDYRLHAMGTVVEGSLDQVLNVLKRCIEVQAADCHRVTCAAKLDYRRGAQGRLASKVASVEGKLGRPVKR